jgi:transposase
MPRRHIDMKKIREVLRLRYGHKSSVHDVAEACKLSTSTVHEYLYRSDAAGLTWPVPDALSDEELERTLFPPRPGKGELQRPLPDFEKFRAELSRKGVTLLLLWKEYRREFPDGYGYSRLADLYKEWEKSSGQRMLQRHKAGEKLFVDFAGLKMKLTDPETSELRDVSVFVAAMGSSQMLFAHACRGEDLKSWLEAHVLAFEFYGALPSVLVPDNLKSAVTKPCRYEPTLNPAYAELARFYDLAVLPARVRKPRDKAKVENGVQQVERWVLAPLRDRVFFSLSELNEAIAKLVGELNGRVMKSSNACRAELFASEDLPAMRPLPESRYVYAEWKAVKIAPDYHVEFEGHKYSVPYRFIGKKLDVRVTAQIVEVFEGSKKIASHPRSISRRGFTTQDAHMPEKHSAAKWTPERFEKWAESVGPETKQFVRRVLASKEHQEHGYRAMMNVLRLEKSFSRNRLEAACARANQVGAFQYANIKSILEKNLDQVALPPDSPPLPIHDNVRGPDYFGKEKTPCAN